MPAVKLSPLFNGQSVTSAGAPASGYKIYTYAAGSSTPLSTYTTSAGTVAQSNPIILDSNGYPGNPIWLQSGLTYKFVLTDASDVQAGIPWDNIAGINDTGSADVSQWKPSGLTPTYISAGSFSMAGDQTTEFHVGRWLQFTTTAGTVYGIITASVYTSLTTITVSLDSGTLDSGLSVVNLSILRADHPAMPLVTVSRNCVINGNFAVNQRSVSGTVTLAAGAYGHDRWKAGASGCTYTFATSGIDTVITITAGSLMQVIEGHNIEGGVYRLSQAGTAQARIGVNGSAPSGSYAAAPLSSSTATANQNVTVEFSTGTVSKVQLQAGAQATAFERRPYPLELSLCKRYLPSYTWVSGQDDIAAGVTTSASAGVATFIFDVPPRVPPTGISSSGTLSATTGLAQATITSLTFSAAGYKSGRLVVGVSGTPYAANQPLILVAGSAMNIQFTGCEL
jgi:hypothetical protein